MGIIKGFGFSKGAATEQNCFLIKLPEDSSVARLSKSIPTRWKVLHNSSALSRPFFDEF